MSLVESNLSDVVEWVNSDRVDRSLYVVNKLSSSVLNSVFRSKKSSVVFPSAKCKV